MLYVHSQRHIEIWYTKTTKFFVVCFVCLLSCLKAARRLTDPAAFSNWS